MSFAPFMFNPLVLNYTFGPNHPLKPERLRRTLAMLELAAPDMKVTHADCATEQELEQLHSSDYIAITKLLSQGGTASTENLRRHGYTSSDNPPFPGMHESAAAYVGCTLAATQAVLDGAPFAFNITGGLHHAFRDKAAGFCIYNDPALACKMLRTKFERVLYVDIDVHHGDGVQALMADDAGTFTYSIHESPKSLWPGTGDWNETVANGTSLNLPIPRGTSGDVWLNAFKECLGSIVERFRPQAVVLQTGTDTHRDDPLAHLNCSVQSWLGACRTVRELNLPTVIVGGGGYDLPSVTRMWTANVLMWNDIELEGHPFHQLPPDWGVFDLLDDLDQFPHNQNNEEVRQTVKLLNEHIVPLIPRY